MITLFGATGYTGRQIAHVLDQQGLEFRLAGRSESRLSELSASLQRKPPFLVANAGYAQSIPALFRDTRTLINCVGPFTDLGEKILGQAAVNGVHYLDTTNELGFIYRVQSYQRLAAQSGAAIIPACAFEVALADCAACAGVDPTGRSLDEIHVLYVLNGQQSSPGTQRSALRSLATSWVVYRDGTWKGQAPGSATRTFQHGGGKYPSFAIPSSESVTIPAHLPVQSIYTWMAVTPLQAFFAPAVIPYFSRFLRSIAGPWLQAWINRRPRLEQPLTASPFQIFVYRMKNGQMQTPIIIAGIDPYALTARIIGEAARVLESPAFDQKGVLPPSAILGGAEFFAKARDWGVSIQGLDG